MENETQQKKKNDLSIPIAIVIAGVVIGGAIIFSNNTEPLGAPRPTGITGVSGQQLADAASAKAPVAELTLRPDDHVFGNPAADVLIVEYSDTECPFCKRFHVTMLEIMNEYENTSNVAWVYRYFPLDSIHPKARKEAEALECANELGGNDVFWKYLDKIFEITPANNGLDAAQLPIIAAGLGLDVAKFNACLSSGKYAERVQKDYESGGNVGVGGTPYSVVWNRKTGKQEPIEGALPFAGVKNILEKVLSAK